MSTKRAGHGPHNPRNSRGFTIVELIAVILIAGVIMTMGVPNMKNMVKNNRRATEINRFVASLNLARSEAVKRRGHVALCESTDGATCTATGKWENGWIVFVNDDGDMPPAVDAGEKVLRVITALDGSVTLRGSGDFANAVSFGWRGFADGSGPASAGGTITYCDGRGAAKARAAIIGSTGRPRISSDTDGDGVDEDDANNDLVCPL